MGWAILLSCLDYPRSAVSCLISLLPLLPPTFTHTHATHQTGVQIIIANYKAGSVFKKQLSLLFKQKQDVFCAISHGWLLPLPVTTLSMPFFSVCCLPAPRAVALIKQTAALLLRAFALALGLEFLLSRFLHVQVSDNISPKHRGPPEPHKH